ERVQGDRAILDRGAGVCAVRADDTETEVTLSKMASPLELRNKRVLVVGLARTGVATAGFWAGRGALGTSTDMRSEAELGEAIKVLKGRVALVLGGHEESLLRGQELLIPSPGVPADAPLLTAARARGITVWSEVELASRFLKGRLIGITGS